MSILLLKLLGWLPNLLSFGTALVGAGTAFLGKLSTDATVRYTTATTASAAIVEASTSADLGINTLRERESEANSRWWVTAWEKPLLFYLCLMHFAAIMIDTTFHMQWRVPAPPTPFDTYEGIILMSDFIVISTGVLTKQVVSAIWK